MAKRIRTTYQAKLIRANISAGEYGAFLGWDAEGPEFAQAFADVSVALKRAAFKGHRRHSLKVIAHHNMRMAQSVSDIYNSNLAL